MSTIKGFVDSIRDFIVGPPPAKVGQRLTPEVREAFQKVDRQAALLHELAVAVQRQQEERKH